MRDIGHGQTRFEQAKKAVEGWAGHRRAGALIHPDRPDLVVGTEVALALRVWPIWVTAVCRIVDVIDETDRFGFAYGTLPHHPESGEESFVVVRDPASDQVRIEITAYSQPVARLAKLGGPIGRAFQRFMANRYVDGFANPVETASPSTSPRVDLTSVRWWFENRETRRITIGQFPNWPLFGIAGTVAVSRLAGPDHLLGFVASILVPSLWLYWGADELVRGVNPWRKLLGSGVLAWQVGRAFGL